MGETGSVTGSVTGPSPGPPPASFPATSMELGGAPPAPGDDLEQFRRPSFAAPPAGGDAGQLTGSGRRLEAESGGGGYPREAEPIFPPGPGSRAGIDPRPGPPGMEQRAEPPLTITIGRIEVTSVSEPAAPPPSRISPPVNPAMSLDDYMKARNGGMF